MKNYLTITVAVVLVYMSVLHGSGKKSSLVISTDPSKAEAAANLIKSNQRLEEFVSRITSYVFEPADDVGGMSLPPRKMELPPLRLHAGRGRPGFIAREAITRGSSEFAIYDTARTSLELLMKPYNRNQSDITVPQILLVPSSTALYFLEEFIYIIRQYPQFRTKSDTALLYEAFELLDHILLNRLECDLATTEEEMVLVQELKSQLNALCAEILFD